MTDQVKSQVLGLSLGLTTAIGVLAYERLVKSYSYFTVGMIVSLSYMPFWLTALFWENSIKHDLSRLSLNKWSIFVFALSGCTGPLWYVIVRKQTAMVGAVYEVKYIMMLALFYLLAGVKPMTWNTAIGVTFALVSIYFISKG